MLVDGCCAARFAAYIPGVNIYFMGAVTAGAVVPVYGAHLQLQAAEDVHATAEAAPFTSRFPNRGGHGWR